MEHTAAPGPGCLGGSEDLCLVCGLPPCDVCTQKCPRAHTAQSAWDSGDRGQEQGVWSGPGAFSCEGPGGVVMGAALKFL